MRRFAFAAGIATLTLAGSAAAQGYGQYNGYGQQGYNQAYAQSDGCKAERDQQKLVGGLIGGALGAVAGAAIGNNLGDGNNYNRRGYRGGGYGGHGYGYGNGGYNDHYRPNRHRRRSGNDDTEQIVAGLILGTIGAVAGSEIAASNVDCNRQVYQGIPAPTRQAYGNGWEQGQPAYQQTGAQQGELYGGQYGQRSNTNTNGNNRNGADTRQCEPVYRETRLPDGRVVTEEVQACRDGVTYYEPRTAYGEWGVQD
jgi:hypothetical protein